MVTLFKTKKESITDLSVVEVEAVVVAVVALDGAEVKHDIVELAL